MLRAKWVLAGVLVILTLALHALDVSYGSFLKITGIERTKGKIILPAERKKYHNVRILDKDTYRFVKSCQSPCVQEVQTVAVSVSEVRPAKERPDMWIAIVAFNQAWQGTFLVFRRGETYQVKSPANWLFLQRTLKQQTQDAVVSAVKDLK